MLSGDEREERGFIQTKCALKSAPAQVPNPLPYFPIPERGDRSNLNPYSANLMEHKDGPHRDRRQKRLERNRESARLSRRRRKQYLEVLEERVSLLCQEMDKGRREHAKGAKKIEDLRRLMLEEALLQNEEERTESVRALMGRLNRFGEELRAVATFQREQLRSLVVSPLTRFVLWLTLQNDSYFRGGRAASKRLSAARIGEKVSD